MTHEIRLYGLGTSRSSRCRWTLAELDMRYDYVEDRALMHSDELKRLHPQGKMPAALIDGEPLFESAAICEHLCDLDGRGRLLSAAGSRERALHAQWVSFTLTEVEAWLWSSARHSIFYPEAKRVPAVIETNTEELQAGLAVLEAHLAGNDYLVGGEFSVTDIIVGWAVNWARRGGHLDTHGALRDYLARLFERPHCTLNPD